MWMLKTHYKLIRPKDLLDEHHLAALDQYENEKIKPGMCVFVRIKAFLTTEIQTRHLGKWGGGHLV